MNSRNYTRTIQDKRGNSYTILKKGVKKVNIGNDVWTIGRKTILNNNPHCVIYGPNNKQYNVYGEDVNKLYGSYCNRQGNTAIEKEVKIYILTSILDDKNNWEFNLNNIPSVSNLKVILENGTIKNINFNGTFYPQEILSKRSTYEYINAHSDRYFKKIVGYRKN